MAALVKTLRKKGDWVLVLPPWGRLYHWQSPDIHQVRIPWGEFFSVTSLQANIPVIEYEEFITGELSDQSQFAPTLSKQRHDIEICVYELVQAEVNGQ